MNTTSTATSATSDECHPTAPCSGAAKALYTEHSVRSDDHASQGAEPCIMTKAAVAVSDSSETGIRPTCIVTASIVVAEIVLAYIVMAYIAMASRWVSSVRRWPRWRWHRREIYIVMAGLGGGGIDGKDVDVDRSARARLVRGRRIPT